MTHRPVLTTNWDRKRQQRTHKVQIEGTNRFLLFTDATLSDLYDQIAAVKGIDRDHVRT
jgi:hypothetical protein